MIRNKIIPLISWWYTYLPITLPQIRPISSPLGEHLLLVLNFIHG